tara:strand:+ start:739 stop:1686 length:948 start_codon:yes stop_codon:yes gene_type:complete
MKIGNVKLSSKLILAPMADVNCAGFRLLCKEYGAGLVSTPMLPVNQIVGAPEKIIERVCFLKKEKPISVQVVGSDSKIAAEATKIIEPYADIIDINLGCPEKAILASNSGSFFVKHPEKIKEIVSPVISNTNKPVTAKIRIGWDDKSINTLKTVKILEDLGVTAIAIHGRTKEQGYSGKANWDEIKKAKEKSNLVIIGNGDVFKPEDAKAMLEQTKCDFVMIGRGSIGNPSIFKRTNVFIKTGKGVPELTEKERIDCFMKFLGYCEKYEKRIRFPELRQQAMWFTKGIYGSKKLRLRLSKVRSIDEIRSVLVSKN